MWRGLRLYAHCSSYLAEVTGARMVIQLIVQCLKDPAYSHITRVIICGDNFSVIQTLATGTQSLLTIPGKSPAPRTWQTVVEQLDALDEVRRSRANPISVEFQWIPRRYNLNADEICTAAMESREPVFRTAPPPPRVFTPPSDKMLDAIAARATSSAPNCIRSIPTFLKPNWQQVLAAVCSWDNAPLALLLAPRVLLRKDAGRDLRERLATLAKNPDIIQQEFWMMAEGCFDNDQQLVHPKQHPQQKPPSDSCNWPLVDRMAAQAPARAIKILSPRSPLAGSADDLIKISGALPIPPHDASHHLPPPIGVPKPKWISATLFLALCSARLARLAAPGHDGWTRELLLASVCKATAPAFEQLVNTIARGDDLSPHCGLQDPTKFARVAMWAKGPANPSKMRLIGMTSAMAKVAWRAALVADKTQLPGQALMLPGGVHSVTRWAEAHLAQGGAIYSADVVDAYWNVRRSVVLQRLVKENNPLAWLFWRTYGRESMLEFRGEVHHQTRGVLPGCAGAQFAFAIDMHIALSSHVNRVPRDPIEVYMFADDGTACSPDAFARFVNACRDAGKSVAKAQLILPSAVAEHTQNIAGVEVNVVPAGRLLGAYVGHPEAAAALFSQHVGIKLDKLNAIAHAPISNQAKWQITRSIERSLVWDATATPPSVMQLVAHQIDERLVAHFKRCFLPAGTEMTHKAMELLYLPSAHGGVGSLSVVVDAPQLYALATASLNGRPSDNDDNELVAKLSVRAVRKRVEEAKIETSTSRDVRLQRHKDNTCPWFDIQHVTKATIINDEAFQLGMANQLRVELPAAFQYKTCCDKASFDHSQRCHRCAAPYRYARHQRIQQEFINTATAYGVIVTTNFYSIGATYHEKHPDAIVFRGAQNQIPMLVDFSCVHQPDGVAYSSADKMAKLKAQKYAGYMATVEQPAFEIVPFIVTSLARITPATSTYIDTIAKFATRKGFVYEVTRRVKTAIINFEPYRKQAIAMRHATGMLTLPTGEPTESNEEDKPDTDDDAD